MTQGVGQQPERRAHVPDRSRTGPKVQVAEADGARPTVHVVGRVDPEVVSETSTVVDGLTASGPRDLVVDLHASWNGAGLLPVLARARHELVGNGGSLQVVGLALPEFLGVLRSASLDEVFLIYDAVRRGAPPA